MRIGIAGIAALYWPITIANGLASHKDAKLVSFSTLGISSRKIKDHLGMLPEEYAQKYHAKQYDTLDEMMESEELDAVALCTRHTEHAKWVERLAPYGKDIFIAKTFTTTMADADRIIATEKKHKIRIAIGPSARFLPAFVAAKQAVDAGRIGTPFSLRICHHHGTIDCFHSKDFYRDKKEGGPELSLGWYLIDLAMHFMRQPITQIYAQYGNFTTPGSPFMDCGKITMQMKDHAIASCDMYFCNRFDFPTWEMEIVGTKGAILLRQSCGDPWSTSITLTTPKSKQNLSLPAKTPHWELFWVDEFMKNRKLSLSSQYAKEVTRISLAARASAQTGKSVKA